MTGMAASRWMPLIGARHFFLGSAWWLGRALDIR